MGGNKKDYLQVALARAAPTSTRSVTPRQPARSWTRGHQIGVKRLSTSDESEGNGEVEVRVVSTTVEGKGWDRSQLGPNHWHVYLQTLHLQLRNQSPPSLGRHKSTLTTPHKALLLQSTEYFSWQVSNKCNKLWRQDFFFFFQSPVKFGRTDSF